jgi:ATP-dependent DNA ligase
VTVFVHACRLGVEGIVSKRIDGTHRSGPCAVWIKVRNPASIARREAAGTFGQAKAGSDAVKLATNGTQKSTMARSNAALNLLNSFALALGTLMVSTRWGGI